MCLVKRKEWKHFLIINFGCYLNNNEINLKKEIIIKIKYTFTRLENNPSDCHNIFNSRHEWREEVNNSWTDKN